MLKDEIIALIKAAGYRETGTMNSDGEYIEYCKGDEEYIFDNSDIAQLSDILINHFKKASGNS